MVLGAGFSKHSNLRTPMGTDDTCKPLALNLHLESVAVDHLATPASKSHVFHILNYFFKFFANLHKQYRGFYLNNEKKTSKNLFGYLFSCINA